MLASPATLQAPRRPPLAARSTQGRCRRPLAAPPRCSASEQQDRHAAAPAPLAHLARSAAAAAAAGLLLLGPGVPAGLADVTTVTAQQAVDMAKPLKEQKVNKGRIWALFVLGATALFGSTVVLENNEKWFPAITRANKAMKQARERQEAREKAAAAEQAAFDQRLVAVQQERQADAAADAAVLEGLQEARARSAAAPAAAAVAAPAAAPAADAAPAAPAAPPAAPESSAASSADSSGTNGSGSGGGGSGGQEARKPLFEISAEQIQESQRLRELEVELAKRKTAAPAGSGAEQEA